MFRASSAHHQESLTIHTASSFCVCVCLPHCLVRNCLQVLLYQMAAFILYSFRLIFLYVYISLACLAFTNLQVSYKTVPQTDTNTETGGCMYSEGLLMMSAWCSKHGELYIYRQKIKIYHKLHLLVYLLEQPKVSIKLVLSSCWDLVLKTSPSAHLQQCKWLQTQALRMCFFCCTVHGFETTV
jgi:hypothetical protein